MRTMGLPLSRLGVVAACVVSCLWIVPAETDVQEIAEIFAFFDASVEEGTLLGDGPGRSADGRPNALPNMIRSAGRPIDEGRDEEACDQLFDARGYWCRRGV